MEKVLIQDNISQYTRSEEQILAPGLYKSGSIFTQLIASWDELIAANVVSEEGHAYFGNGMYPTHKAMDILAGDLVLPEGITELADYAYSACDRLTEIILPQSLIRIGNSAFDYCDGLTELIIPDSVTSIGKSAFEECIHIEKVTIGPNVTYFGDFAFANCVGITKVTIKEGATLIGPWSFCSCKKLTEIKIPSTITTIREGAFSSCRKLNSINIPANTTSINPRAFVSCEGVTSITVDANNAVYHSKDNCLIETNSKTLVLVCANSTIPNDGSVTKIGDYAFCASNERTDIMLPDKITSIGEGAFSYCKLVNVFIPKNVKSIDAYAFSSCCNLAAVTFQKGSRLTVIGTGAFDGCSSLVNIEIPDSVITIERNAFCDCPNLSTVSLGAENSHLGTIGNFVFYNCHALSTFIFAGSGKKWSRTSLGIDWCRQSLLSHIVCSDGLFSF